MTRVMVDMSVTLLHHGHTRLLRFAKQYGVVIVALTTDDEIVKHKGYHPEMCFEARKELVESIKYVDSVVPSPWLIDLDFLKRYEIDLLVHGDDNSNDIPHERLLIVPRTPGISSSILRSKVVDVLTELDDSREVGK